MSKYLNINCKRFSHVEWKLGVFIISKDQLKRHWLYQCVKRKTEKGESSTPTPWLTKDLVYKKKFPSSAGLSFSKNAISCQTNHLAWIKRWQYKSTIYLAQSDFSANWYHLVKIFHQMELLSAIFLLSTTKWCTWHFILNSLFNICAIRN